MSETADDSKPQKIIDAALLNDLEAEHRRAHFAAESARARMSSVALDVEAAERQAAGLDHIKQVMTARAGQSLDEVLAEFEAEAERLDALVPGMEADVERKKQVARDWEGHVRILRRRREEALARPEVGGVAESWEFTRRERAYLTDAVMVFMKQVEQVPENDRSELPELQRLLERLTAPAREAPEITTGGQS